MIPGAFASEITKIPPMDEVLRRHTRVSQEFPKHFQPLAGRPIRKLGCSLPDAALDHGFTACRIKKAVGIFGGSKFDRLAWTLGAIMLPSDVWRKARQSKLCHSAGLVVIDLHGRRSDNGL